MARYDADDVYCIPGTAVLKNKAGITNQDLLDEYEGDFTAIRLLELAQNPVEGAFDLAHLCRIHTHLFQDVYDWGGGSTHRRHHQRRQSFLQRAPNSVLLKHCVRGPCRRKLLGQPAAQSFFQQAGTLLVRDQCHPSVPRRQWSRAETFHFAIGR